MRTHAPSAFTTTAICALLAATALATFRAQAGAAVAEAPPDVAPAEHINPMPSLSDDVGPRPEDVLADAGVAATIPAMRAVLQDREKDFTLRAASAMALVRTGDRSVVPVLLAALDDPDDDLRSAIVHSLARLPDPRAVPKLKAILDDTSTRGSDGGAYLRGSAAYALIKIHTDEAAAVVLRTVLDPQEQPHMRYSVLDDIDDMGMDGIARDLRPLLLESDAELRIGAAAAMGRMGDRDAIPTLARGIVDGETADYLRAEALIALEHVTGQNFGVAGADELDERVRRVDAWCSSTGATMSERRPQRAHQSACNRTAIVARVEAWWQLNRRYYE